MQQPGRVFVIDFFQNGLGQFDAVDFPSALRWNLRGRIVKVFVVSFKKAVIDLVQLVVEYLLREFIAVRSRIRSEENPVLILVEKLARGAGLAP